MWLNVSLEPKKSDDLKPPGYTGGFSLWVQNPYPASLKGRIFIYVYEGWGRQK